MAEVTIPRSLPTVRWSMISKLPALMLFLWYVFYTGLSRLVPYYEMVDDGILILMLAITAIQILRRNGRLRFPNIIVIGLLFVNLIVLLSSLINQVRLADTVEYIIRINRAFIILLYVFGCDLDIERLLQQFVSICRVLLVLNLPAMLYYIVKYNITLLQTENNDMVRGFFPFGNNDSIVLLLVIILLYDAYAVLIQQNITRAIFFGSEYLLLVTTLNWKIIIMTTVGLALIAFLRARYKLRNALILALVFVLPAIVVTSEIVRRFNGVAATSPTYFAAEMILSGKVAEYNWLLGTGPGTFTSPMAYENSQYLTGKYGLLALKYYWSEVYKGPTGTLTTWTSSALILLGETGVLTTVIVVFLLFWLVWQCYIGLEYSPACLMGFILGLYILPIGVFLDSWSWGYEVMMLMLGVKAAADWKILRRDHLMSDKALVYI
jgi:hypothetical protein